MGLLQMKDQEKDAQLEKKQQKTELINTESLQTSRISSNKSGQDFVLLNIHLNTRWNAWSA